MRLTRNFDEILHEALKNPIEAQAYLEVAIELYKEDGNTEAFLMALRSVTEAQGGLAHLEESTKLSGKNLNQLFSSKGNPRIDTVDEVLHGLGFKLAVESLKSSSARPPAIPH